MLRLAQQMSTIFIARGRRKSTTLVVSSSMADAIEMVVNSKVLTLLLLALRRLLLELARLGRQARFWGRQLLHLGRQARREVAVSNQLFRWRVLGLWGRVALCEVVL